MMRKIQIAALLAVVATFPCAADSAEYITTTLLPYETVTVSPSGTTTKNEKLTISTKLTASQYRACLNFDLDPVARSRPTKITEATLRMIGTSQVENTQVVRVFEANEQCTGPKIDRSVASWTIRTSGEEARTSSSGLRQAIEKAIETLPKTLSLFLRSESRNTNWSYGSIKPEGRDSDEKPRLIVTFEVEGDASIASGDTTDWTFFASGAPTVDKADDKAEIFHDLLPQSEPLVLGDDIIVIAGGKLERLSTNGVPCWPGVTVTNPGSRSAIDRQGWLYNFGSDRKIRVFDLDRNGALIGEVSLDFLPSDTKLDNALTIAPGGNIYFATSGTHSYIYGLTPWTAKAAPKQLLPIWRSRITTGGGATNIAVSPPGPDFMTYTLATEGFFALDAATGTRSETSKWKADKNWPRRNPVVSAGPEHEYAILAAGSSNGIVRAFSGDEWYWKQDLAVSQPTIDQAEEPCKSRVVAIAGGRFTRMNLCNGMKGEKENGDWCQSDKDKLAATSNIVLDGASNAYFWNGITGDSGKFYIYGPDCKLIMEQSLSGLEKKLTLRFAADGSVITRDGTILYALQRRVAGTTLNIGNAQLKNGYAYVGNAVRVSENTTLSAGMKVLIRGKQGVGFGNGFRVQSGAELAVQVQ